MFAHRTAKRALAFLSIVAIASALAGCTYFMDPRAHPTTLVVTPIQDAPAFVEYGDAELNGTPSLKILGDMLRSASTGEQRRDVESAVVADVFSSIGTKWRDKYGEENRGTRTILYESNYFRVDSYG